jgi:farnesyl-diphosphate farnesyltransferase
MSQPSRPTTDMLALLRGVSRSFYLSIRLLPAPLRRPIAVAYLLARAADTLVDTAELPAGERLAMLETWARAIDGGVAASEVSAVSSSFAPLQADPLERHLILALPQCLAWLDELAQPDRGDIRAVLRHITRGQALDIERFPQGTALRALDTPAQLDEYTYLVAGCVGEFWTDLCFRHLPGFALLPQQEMRELGRAYGMGLQLVNILRDAGADLADGRCYLPAGDLAMAGIDPQDILRYPERFEPVWLRWHAQAQRGLELGMRYADSVTSRRVRAASALPALIAARTLELLRTAGPQRLQGKVKVPRHEVRAMMARLAFTFAGRAPLQALFESLRVQAASGGWENPRP